MSKEQKKKFKMLSFIAVPVLIFAWSIWYSQGVKNDQVNRIPEILTVKQDDYKKGNLAGKVVLIEYLDFECEACKAYYPILKQLEKDFPNDLMIVNRYFPLGGHKNSMTAALSAEAAGQQGKYYSMHDMLFETQDDWGNKGIPDPKIFVALAEKVGLDMQKYAVDIEAEEVKNRVNRDFKESGILKNTGTPSLFLQGKRLENISGYEDLKIRIQAEVDKVNSQK
jgi:protein-disulfide isomerase